MEDKYLKALYVQFSDGTELKGVDAFIYVWSNTRGYNWLAKIIRLPIIFQIAKFCYIPIAFIIFWPTFGGPHYLVYYILYYRLW